MSSVVTVTGSGQITIPAVLRRKLNIATGDRLIVSEGEDGQIVVQSGPRSIMELKGIFPLKPGIQTDGDFDDLIQEAFEDGYARDWNRQSDE